MEMVDRCIDLIWIRLREAPALLVAPLAGSQVLSSRNQPAQDRTRYRLWYNESRFKPVLRINFLQDPAKAKQDVGLVFSLRLAKPSQSIHSTSLVCLSDLHRLS